MRPTATTVLLTLCLVIPHLQAVEYDINLSRRAKTGDRYHVVCTATDAARFTWTVDGAVQPSTQIASRCSITADAETVMTGVDGSEVHIRLVVSDMTYTVNNEKQASLPAGSVVDVKWGNDKSVYLLNNAPIADQALNRALSYIFIAEPPTHSPDDKICGSTTRKSVGQKWPVNAEALAHHLTIYSQLPTKAEKVTGFITLAEATETELKFTSDFTATDLGVKLEPWLTVTESRMQMIMNGFFPINVQQRPRKKSYRTTLSATGIGEKDGKPHRLDMVYRFATDYDMKPLP